MPSLSQNKYAYEMNSGLTLLKAVQSYSHSFEKKCLATANQPSLDVKP